MRTSTIWSAFCCTIFPAVNYSTRRRRQYKYFGAALDARITEADALRVENLTLFEDLHNRMVENTAMMNHNLELIEDNRRLNKYVDSLVDDLKQCADDNNKMRQSTAALVTLISVSHL